MNTIPLRHIDEIKYSLAIAKYTLDEIHSGETHNWTIQSPDWLLPVLDIHTRQNGMDELTYYTQIKDAMESALERRVIPHRYAPVLVNSPPEIRQLLENDSPERSV